MRKIAIVYFSRKGQNYWDGSIRELQKGNTEIAAEAIQKAVGGDLFEVEPVKIYASDYTACTVEAKEELRKKERVAVKAFKDDLNHYDILFVGYPNWWGTMPMVLWTFLEHYDLSGKKIAPFCTNGGSGLGGSEQDIRKLCPGAEITPGLSVRGCDVNESYQKITDWARRTSVKEIKILSPPQKGA